MRRAAAGLGVALATTAPLAGHLARFPDAPPPATTGGFGEPTCVSCHFGVEVPDPAGAVAIEGLPEAYAPGRRYEIAIVLTRPGMERAGFQLSARFAGGPAEGLQAGALRSLGPGTAVVADGGIAYLQQTAAGTGPGEPGRARWRAVWIAPDRAAGPVVFHVAANAANGDESPFGDHVYAVEARVAPAAP